MVTIFLIRHGTTDQTGVAISGRRRGVHLNPHGREQALGLARHLGAQPINRIYTSPLERARETAEPLAKALGLQIRVEPALTDIDFGPWSGQTLAALELLDDWKRWNRFRSSLRIPNGELMTEVQGRMMHQMERLLLKHPNETVIVVSHADPIRSVLAHFLGVPLDLLHRIEISPASVSVLEVNDWGAQVRCVNLQYHSKTF